MPLHGRFVFLVASFLQVNFVFLMKDITSSKFNTNIIQSQKR